MEFKIELEDNVPVPLNTRMPSTEFNFLKEVPVGKSFKIDVKNDQERKAFDSRMRKAIYDHNKDAKLNRDIKHRFIIRTTAFDGAGKPLQYRIWSIDSNTVEVVSH